MKKLLLSLFLSILIVGIIAIGGQILYAMLFPVDPIQVGDIPPPWPYSGLPLSMFSYSDCPAGCIPNVNIVAVLLDILFWFFIMLFLINKFISKKSK